MIVHTVKVFTGGVKMLGDLEIGDTFRIIRAFGETLNCKVVEKYPTEDTVVAFIEQYGYSDDFDYDQTVDVDPVQHRINTVRE